MLFIENFKFDIRVLFCCNINYCICYIVFFLCFDCDFYLVIVKVKGEEYFIFYWLIDVYIISNFYFYFDLGEGDVN